MTATEQIEYLNACQRAFVVFASRFPDYPQTEAHAREMACELTASGLRPDNADHLAAVWERLRPRTALAPASAPVPEMDDVEREARELISSGRITLESINAMSNSQYELAARSEVFCRALSILEPRREQSILTQGELDRAAALANISSTDSGIPTTASQRVQDAENWKKEHFAKIAAAATPAPSTSRRVVNLHQAMHMPKSVTPKELAAAIKHQKESEKFLEETALEMDRARRVKARR
jgi:hypothetical protein